MSRHTDLIASDRDAPPADMVHGYVSPDLLERNYEMFKRLVNSNADPFLVLDKLYTVADKMLAKAYPKDKCERGCAHCCYVAVGITGLEARHIESRTGHTVTNDSNKERDVQIREPCVFLKDNECSIYEHRPLVCRTFRTFDDPELCTDAYWGKPHWVLGLVEPGEGGFEWLNTVYFSTLITYLKRYDKFKTFADIRHFFGEQTDASSEINHNG